jgi:hypothetical protein
MSARKTATEVDHVVIRGVRLDLASLVDDDVLRAPKKLQSRFAHHQPFPHLVLEGLFSANLLEMVEAEFDGRGWRDWDRYDSANEIKRGSSSCAEFGPATQLYFNLIHSKAFVRFLEGVTGMAGLLPDPQLFAGGMHEIPDGGRFALHIDFNRHPVTSLINRLVVITYLNKAWHPSYGGSLELWNAAEQRKAVEIEPVFGRTIVFAQSAAALHGHPVPVHAPNGRPRRSVAAYYYANENTLDDDRTFRTTTFAVPMRLGAKETLLRWVKYVVPPVAVDLAREVRARLPHPAAQKRRR